MRVKPTPRFVRALVVGFLLLLLAPVLPGVLLVVAGCDLLVLALFAAEAVRLRRAVGLRIVREIGPRLSLGAWNAVRLEVESLAALPLTVHLFDRYPREFDLEPGGEEVRLTAYGRGEIEYAVRPRARGRYRFGGVRFEAEGRLGLAALTGEIALDEDVKVYPDLRGLRRLALGSRAEDASLLGLRAFRREGSGDEFDKLREYQPDDDYREINWKATAKRSKPVTQVYETERSQRVILAIDCGRSMAARTGDLTKLDLAVNAALVLAHVALRLGDLVGLAVFSTEVRRLVAPKRGSKHFARLLEALYEVREELCFVDYKALTREIAARRLRRGLLVIFTDLLDEASARPLVDAARVLGRKHAVLVVAPSDPVVLAAADAPAAGTEDVYRAIAAREALGERRTVIESVRRLGVEVVDSRAAEMAVQGVNRYLEMKRRRAI